MVIKSPSFKWSDLSNLAGGYLRGTDAPLSGLFQVDSRKLSSGDIFIAIPGSASDGHDFLMDAVDAGASGAVIEKRWFDKSEVVFPEEFKLLIVPDSEEFIVEAASKRLKEASLREVIAITGSVGKTTTREMLYIALKGSYRVHRARSSHNTRIGCAITVLEMPCDAEILILEMGTNHPGEIAEMVDLFPETIAVLTEIIPAHLEGLKSVDGVLRAKLEILKSNRLHRIIYNSDSEFLSGAIPLTMKDRDMCELIPVGKSGQYSFESPSFTWRKGPKLQFIAKRKKDNLSLKFESLLFGAHYSLLICLAWAVAVGLEIDPETALKRLSSFRSFSGRGNILCSKSGIWLVDESYNANPGSMKAALTALKDAKGKISGQVLAVLGDMRELGSYETEAHQEILDAIADKENVFLYGDKWLAVSEGLPVFRSQEELLEKIKPCVSPGDLIMVKGSRSNNLEKILEELVLL